MLYPPLRPARGTPRRSGSSTSFATRPSASSRRGSRRCCSACFCGPRFIEQLRLTQHGSSNVREDTPDAPPEEEGHARRWAARSSSSRIGLPTLLFADLSHRGCVWVALLLTARLRLHRLPRRLAEALEAELEGAGRAEEARCCRRCSTSSASSASSATWKRRDSRTSSSRPGLTLPFVPTRHFNPDLGWLYVVLRLGGGGRDVERGEPHRRARRAGHRAHHRRRRPPSPSSATSRAAGSTSPTCVEVAGQQRLVSTPLWRYLGILPVRRRRRAGGLLRRDRRRRASPSSGSTPTRRASSWATSARSRSAARSATLAVLTKNEVASAIIHGVFLAETLSVMIQVASFKMTGKRVFKMAPIHHHFELQGAGRAEDHRALLDRLHRLRRASR